MSTTYSDTPDEAGFEEGHSANPIQIRGSVRVLCEIRSLEAQYGEAPFSADRSMLGHWASLIEGELDAEIRERIPDMQKRLEALEQAKKISPEVWNAQVTI